MDSPRGRIYLMKALAEGRLELDRDAVRHLDLCLECRGCETDCPSGVRYGLLIEHARGYLGHNWHRGIVERCATSSLPQSSPTLRGCAPRWRPSESQSGWAWAGFSIG
jgi:Fe-S oxidoreductase